MNQKSTWVRRALTFALCLCGQIGIMAIRIIWGCLRVAFFLCHDAPLCRNQSANIGNAPCSCARAKFYWLGIASGFAAFPPCGLANGNNGRNAALNIANDLRQAKKTAFRKLVHFG